MTAKSNENLLGIKKNNITIKDVAKKAGVSIAAVSYAINGIEKINEDTKQRILSAIDDLGYVPNITARNLAKGQGRLIGILVPVKESYKRTIFTDNPFYQEFISGAEYGARERGFSTLIISTDNEESCINLLKGSKLKGIVVLGIIEPNLYRKLLDIEIPVVVIDQEKKNESFYYINTDDENGAYTAVDYLIRKGHRNIGFLTDGLEDSIVHKNRFKGYKRALKKNNITFKEELVIEAELTYEGGISAANYIDSRKSNLTAVFSISDIMALGLIKGLHRNNIKVPKDISVVGFDDIRSSKYFIPELTTIRQDIFSKGEKAVQLITDKSVANMEKEIIVPVELIERESVCELENMIG